MPQRARRWRNQNGSMAEETRLCANFASPCSRTESRCSTPCSSPSPAPRARDRRPARPRRTAQGDRLARGEGPLRRAAREFTGTPPGSSRLGLGVIVLDIAGVAPPVSAQAVRLAGDALCHAVAPRSPRRSCGFRVANARPTEHRSGCRGNSPRGVRGCSWNGSRTMVRSITASALAGRRPLRLENASAAGRQSRRPLVASPRTRPPSARASPTTAMCRSH